MDEIFRSQYGNDEWPIEAENMYERVEVLGRGSFGIVWMARRTTPPKDELDDEYVALKNIEIKEQKGRVYAQREISILTELRHPHVIRLVRAFPVHDNRCQLVALQMARGPNLQYLVTKRGALGLPLARLVSRHLIAAVSYLHGRAVLHRDIKPTNCILENTQLKPQDLYDWVGDDMIWSDTAEAADVVSTGKYKLLLVDFGFARALEGDEIEHQPRRMRGSIANERQRMSITEVANMIKEEYGDAIDKEELEAAKKTMLQVEASALPEDFADLIEEDESEDDLFGDDKKAGDGAGTAETAGEEDEDEEDDVGKRPRRLSAITQTVPFQERNSDDDDARSRHSRGSRISRQSRGSAISSRISRGTNFSTESGRRMRGRRRDSTARTKVRSMSALGTKAYAAPEIKHELRNKTRDDMERSREALTECVADYGMIVDAYSVGWTLRVVLTGIPPNVTISQYMRKVSAASTVQDQVGDGGCLCFRSSAPRKPPREIKVRDTSEIPTDATLLISAMTKSNPEDRMTVREAQYHAYIRGGKGGEEVYKMPEGDYPSKHGDPVVPLDCARSISTALLGTGRAK